MNGKFSWKYAIGCGGLGLLAVLGYLGVTSFMNYASLDRRFAPVSPITVQIQNPAPGATFALGSMLMIEAQSQGAEPVVALELWADGTLVHVQGAPGSQGLSPFPADFHWTAEAVGTHTLFVRAFGKDGHVGTSNAVPVQIVLNEELSGPEASNQYSPGVASAPDGPGGAFPAPPPGPEGDDEPPAPYDPPENPDPEVVMKLTDLPLGETWGPSLGGWLNGFILTPLPPSAPGIPAVAEEGCTGRLWISDNSTNEEGFFIYRRDPGMASFARIATLAAHVGSVFTFEDPDLGGTYQYYATAFNAGGESAPSNINQAEVDSPNCPPDSKPGFAIQLVKLSLGTKMDMGYCYYSLGGVDWFRYPADPESFLPPTADGSGLDALGSIVQAVDPGGKAALDLECWGWGADGLHMVGRWHWDDVFNKAPQPGPGSGPGTGPGTGGGSSDIEVVAAGNPGFKLKYDYRIPKVLAWGAFDNAACALHLGSHSFWAFLICGSTDPEPAYTVWGLGISCPAKEFNASAICFTQEDVFAYNVYDTLMSPGPNAQPYTTINFGDVTTYMLQNWTDCTPREVYISALVKDGNETLEGVPSNHVFYTGHPNCGYLQGQFPHDFRLTWDYVDFSVGDINDDPDIDDSAEGFGYLRLSVQSGFKRYWTLQDNGHSVNSYGGPEGDTHAPTFEFEDNSGDNPYYWADMPLSITSSGPCSPFLSCVTGPGVYSNNNKVDFPMFFGESANLKVRLWDADIYTEDDPICFAPSDVFWFSTGDVENSPGGVMHGSVSRNHSDGDCTVTFTIQALP